MLFILNGRPYSGLYSKFPIIIASTRERFVGVQQIVQSEGKSENLDFGEINLNCGKDLAQNLELTFKILPATPPSPHFLDVK